MISFWSCFSYFRIIHMNKIEPNKKLDQCKPTLQYTYLIIM